MTTNITHLLVNFDSLSSLVLISYVRQFVDFVHCDITNLIKFHDYQIS